MKLIIGGFSQGKLEYAKKDFSEVFIFDENNYSELVAFFDSVNKNIIINNFHLIVKEILMKDDFNNSIEDFMKLIFSINNICVISDEIGNGVIPMEKIDREYREIVGRLLIQIAKSADKVERIICGIPQKIK